MFPEYFPAPFSRTVEGFATRLRSQTGATQHENFFPNNSNRHLDSEGGKYGDLIPNEKDKNVCASVWEYVKIERKKRRVYAPPSKSVGQRKQVQTGNGEAGEVGR